MGLLSTKETFMNRIQDEMEKEDFSLALCIVSPVHSQVTSLGVLRYFLGERKEKGLFLSTMRPHHYLHRLLIKERLPLDHIVMVDIVQRFDDCDIKEVLERGGRPGLQDIRPSIMLDKTLDSIYNAIEEDPDITFLMVDNISSLFAYIPVEKVVQLVKDIHDLVRIKAGFRLIVMVDQDVDMDILRDLYPISDKQLEITPEFIK